MPTLNVIITSTRPGQAGLPVAEWLLDEPLKLDGALRVSRDSAA